MGELVDQAAQAAAERVNQESLTNLDCLNCASARTGSSPRQEIAGLLGLPALTEAVPSGVVANPNQFIPVLVVQCSGCGQLRFYQASEEVQNAVAAQEEVESGND